MNKIIEKLFSLFDFGAHKGHHNQSVYKPQELRNSQVTQSKPQLESEQITSQPIKFPSPTISSHSTQKPNDLINEINFLFENQDTDFNENDYYLFKIKEFYRKRHEKRYPKTIEHINYIFSRADYDYGETDFYIEEIVSYYRWLIYQERLNREELANFYREEYGGEEIGGHFGPDYFDSLEKDRNEDDWQRKYR